MDACALTTALISACGSHPPRGRQFYIQPKFTDADIAQLDKVVQYANDLNNKPYMPGPSSAPLSPATLPPPSPRPHSL